MRKLLLTTSIGLLAVAQGASAQGQAASPNPQAVAAARASCAGDLQRLCPGVQPGGGRLIACLKQHKDEVSDGCKRAVMAVLRGVNGGGGPGGAGPAASGPGGAAPPEAPQGIPDNLMGPPEPSSAPPPQ
jgi:hypothetical protein